MHRIRETLALRVLTHSVTTQQPSHRHSLGHVDVAELYARSGFEQDDARGVPRQPCGDVGDHHRIGRITRDEHSALDALPVRIVEVLSCVGHATSIGKALLTYQCCISAPVQVSGPRLEA